MPASYSSATIEALLLPADPADFYTSPVHELEFSLDPNGILGDERHRGNIEYANARTPAYRKKHDQLLNRSSVSFVGSEDLDYIANELDLDPNLVGPSPSTRVFLARCLGANIVLGNFQGTLIAPTFRHLAPGTDFGPRDGAPRKFTDATVMITRTNAPCDAPARMIQQMYPGEVPDLSRRFINAARGRRGFVGMVAKAGVMTVGQSVDFVRLGD